MLKNGRKLSFRQNDRGRRPLTVRVDALLPKRDSLAKGLDVRQSMPCR